MLDLNDKNVYINTAHLALYPFNNFYQNFACLWWEEDIDKAFPASGVDPRKTQISDILKHTPDRSHL